MPTLKVSPAAAALPEAAAEEETAALDVYKRQGLGVKRDVRSEPEIANYALRGLLRPTEGKISGNSKGYSRQGLPASG